MSGIVISRVILLAGPTASGKSALALRIAERVGGTIINADSMQVYRDLRIITARPMPQEEARVPHLLYGHVDAAENYSVGRWCVDAGAAIAEAARADRVAILAGGTGLYFKALTQGLAAVPPIPAGIRATVRARLKQRVAPLYDELLRHDPQAIKIFLDVDRAELYRRIDARFDAMLASGALDEVRQLAARHLDPSLPAMKAHGVPWLIRQFAGEITLAEAAEGAKRDTRRYTKRQATWFRHQLPDWEWLTPEAAEQTALDALPR